MVQYHFPAAEFGNPSFPLTQTQQQQFKSNPVRDVGRGLFAAYNPTGPLPVSARFEWTGATLSQFRSAWENAAQLNQGNNWFTMDLPLMFDHSGVADVDLFPYNSKVDFIFAVTISSSAVLVANYGDVDGTNLLGLFVQGIGIDTNDLLTVNVGPQLPGAKNADLLTFEFIDTGEIVDLQWNGNDYSRTITTLAPLAILDWFGAALGEVRLISLRPYAQQFQRYPVHVKTPYDASMSGYDRWDVKLELEVDASPQMVIP